MRKVLLQGAEPVEPESTDGPSASDGPGAATGPSGVVEDCVNAASLEP